MIDNDWNEIKACNHPPFICMLSVEITHLGFDGKRKD